MPETETRIPTLEDLRQAPTAAWLWDGMRGRIVWANAAGVAAFECQSLFDLIDRPFDPREPGVSRIAELTRSLPRETREEVALHFPSAGFEMPLDCIVHLHALADGRAGLLVHVVEKPAASNVPEPLQDNLAAQTLSRLPMALIISTGDGAILQFNDTARQLFNEADTHVLADVLGSPERADHLLQRLKTTSLVTSVERVNGPYGSRDLRLMLTRTSEQIDGPVAVLMEDVTERRALEREMLAKQVAAIEALPKYAVAKPDEAPLAGADALVPPFAQQPMPHDGNAFEKLTKSLEESLRRRGPVVRDFLDLDSVVPPSSALAAATGLDTAADENVADAKHAVAEGARHELTRHEPPATSFSKPADGTPSIVPEPAAEPKADATFPDEPTEPEAIEAQVIPFPVPASPVANTTGGDPTEPRHLVAHGSASERSEIANDELHAILDVVSDGIITLSADGRILGFSAGAEAIFGRSMVEVIGKPFAELLNAEHRKTLGDYLAGLKGPGLASVFNDGREVNATLPQGGVVPLFLTIGVLQSPHSRAAFCAVVRDITQWKRTERELLSAKERAEAASRQKSDFLARISHELRTPLNAILGFSEVMREERFGPMKNEKYKAYANDIHASGSHLLALINDLLDLSKVEAGKFELNFTAVSLEEATDYAMRILQDQAAMARVLVRKSIPPKLPRIVADHKSLRQIMLNLISNAIKYTNPGGQVIISVLTGDKGSLVLRVTDTGIGMTDAQLRDALEPFSRVDTPNRERQGTGLGLPLTKALVEANRASLSISSSPDMGTMAEVVFPGPRVLAE